jgi:acetyltransferase-like isoleucine patch superfamily enzyme
MNSKLSIITINFNNLTGLKRTVDSVFSQTWKEFEYIIIDGGSTDGSEKFIEENGHKLTFWRSEPDRGIYHAMNKGVLASTGEYCLFLNSGDELASLIALENCIAHLNNADLITFDLNYRGTKDEKSDFPEIISFEYFRGNSLGHPSTFIKRKLFELLNYDEKLKIVSDWKFFILAIFKYNASYKKVNSVLSTFYCDGISSDPKNKETIHVEFQLVLEKYFGAKPNIQYGSKNNFDGRILSNWKSSKLWVLLRNLKNRILFLISWKDIFLFLINLNFLIGLTKIIKGKKVKIIGNTPIVKEKVTIGINGNHYFFNDERTIFENRGILKINGLCDFGKGTKVYVNKHAILEIGNNTFITGKTSIICFQKILIGSNCAISWGVHIMDHDYHTIDEKPINKPIIIGNNVWIGSNVNILKGVNIPDNCVIAAGSVVTKSFDQENLLIAGNPAKVIREQISWKR